ncbi:MAG TPA: ABC transporter permease [Anaerolineales bacterium]|nr:ABC transporter permease [Anaerolineales bacterium]
MEIAPGAQSPLARQQYLWRIRLGLFWRNTKEFLLELRKHPLALLGGIVIVVYILAAIFAEQITVHNPGLGNLRLRLDPPAWQAEGSWEYPLGTDAQGRDLLTRIIYGARVSLTVGLLSVGISVIIGVVFGALAGYYRGRFDSLISRFADLLLAFPFLIFAIGVMAFLGPGFTNLILALTFKGWVEFYRLVRGEMLSEKTQEYVEAARVTGQSHNAIIVQEILPNIIQSVFVLATLRMGYMIIMEASLSFLGLGIPPRIPAWGSMVSSGRDYMLVAWWVSTFPGLAIVILVMAINLFGEGLRDILDPRLKVEG